MVTISSGNGLIVSGNKPLAEVRLAEICDNLRMLC